MSEVSEHPQVRAHREVVERLWTQPLLDLCGDDLPDSVASTVLAAESRCGAVLLRWLPALPADTRVMALDSSGPMLDEARSRIDEAAQQRIFFVQQRVTSLSYADGVFDGATCFHGLVTSRQTNEGLSELCRVVSPGGTVMVCAPLRTSFGEFYDLLDEALRACGLQDVLGRLEELRGNLLGSATMATLAGEQPLEEVVVEELSWEVAFSGGREYLYSPLIQETFFPHWIGVVRASEREQVLGYIGNAIDTYWRDETLTSQVKAVLLTARRAEQKA